MTFEFDTGDAGAGTAAREIRTANDTETVALTIEADADDGDSVVVGDDGGDDAGGDVDGGQPGFGAVVAVVAIHLRAG